LEVNSKIKNQRAKLRYPKGMIFFYDDFFIVGQAEKAFRGLFLALDYRDFVRCQAGVGTKVY
jgi:hypothetical protein